MFRAVGTGSFVASAGGAFIAAAAVVPDELRLVVSSTLIPTSVVYVRVLTSGTGNDVSDMHNADLLSSHIVEASVTDGAGVVGVDAASVVRVLVASGSFAMYRMQLERAVLPLEVTSVSVRSPYTRDMRTTAPDALVQGTPLVEAGTVES